MLLKYIDNKKNIFSILNKKYPLSYLLFVKLIQIKKNILSLFRGNFSHYNNNEQLKEYFIAIDSFNFRKRKNGVSVFGRLHNSQEFLEKAVESHINAFDEIILVNNNSTDNTEKICRQLKEKYPNKIKFYNYPFEVYKIGTLEYKKVSENSIHSLSYYYNRTLSKTTYKYAIKFDDDHICVDSELQKVIGRIKKDGLRSFLQIPLINIYKYGDELSYSYSSLKSSFAGLFGDFGFFPVDGKSYFIKQKSAETIIFPHKIETGKIGFLHLKWLKSDSGLNNYGKKVQKKLIQRMEHTQFKKLDQDYSKILEKNGI